MPKVKKVEERIANVEKFFKVSFYKNGVNVRSDKEDIPQYGYSSAAPSSWTIAEWRSNRFKTTYPGYDVKVFLKSGSEAAGNMKLATVRGND